MRNLPHSYPSWLEWRLRKFFVGRCSSAFHLTRSGRTYGDYYFTPLGFILTVLGTILAAMKTIATNVLQTPATFDDSSRLSKPLSFIYRHLHPQPTLSTLSPLEHLHFLSPLAFVQSLALALFTGELKTMYHHTLNHFSYTQQLFLLVNGMLAFGLNVASFGANRRVGAVSMSVAGNYFIYSSSRISLMYLKPM